MDCKYYGNKCPHQKIKIAEKQDPIVNVDEEHAYVEYCIYEYVKMFNDNGFKTRSSCCGHGGYSSNDVFYSKGVAYKTYNKRPFIMLEDGTVFEIKNLKIKE